MHEANNGCYYTVQGDSGFIVVRNGKVVAKSRPLQHYFDCPLQVCAVSALVYLVAPLSILAGSVRAVP